MDEQMNREPEAWKGHGHDDEKYGNRSLSTEEYLRAFNTRVLRDHQDFDKAILSEFGRFFKMWEEEFERIEQVSAQSAAHKLHKYLKI